MQTNASGRGAGEEHILISVPAKHKDLAETMQKLVDGVTQKAEQAGRVGRSVDCAGIERELLGQLAEVGRAANKEVLQALEIDAARLVVDGKTYNRVGRAPGKYHTFMGTVSIERAQYRQSGGRDGKVVDAISLRSGVVGRGWMPGTAEAMAHLLQQGTSREAQDTARRLGCLPYSRVSFDRVAHDLGKQWVKHHVDIEEKLGEEMEIPDQARSVSVSLDRVALPMEEPRKRPVGRPRSDAPKRPVKRVFRMAYCATLTFHDEQGGALHSIRHACMPGGNPELLCLGMGDDIARILLDRPDLDVSALADGAAELWSLLLSSLPAGCSVTALIDFWHLVEKLAAAALVIHGDESRATLHRWKKALLRRKGAAGEILEELRASGREYRRHGDSQPVHEAITYIENHGDKMDYASARRRGLPIGSGTVEATCKSLVGTRMKRPGARWKHESGEHVLKLRALAMSDRWEAAMADLHRRRRTGVRPAA